MADVKISALPAATTPLGGTEVLPVVQSGSTVKVSIADVTAGRTVSAENVGVGNTNPGYRLDVSAGETTPGLGYGMRLRANATANGGAFQFTDSAVTSQWGYIAANTSEFRLAADSRPLTFFIGSERGRFDTSGNLLVGRTTPASGERLGVTGATGSDPLAFFINSSAGSTLSGVASSINAGGNNTNSYHFAGVTETVAVWYLYGNGTTSYTSDIRVKKNVETTRDGYLDDVSKLRVVKYNWYNDEDDAPRELGFIAQEVEQVFPGLVQDAAHPTKDGKIHKVLKASVLVPILIKALQEANVKIDALADRVAVLES
jgi:hypothetical protein